MVSPLKDNYDGVDLISKAEVHESLIFLFVFGFVVLVLYLQAFSIFYFEMGFC